MSVQVARERHLAERKRLQLESDRQCVLSHLQLQSTAKDRPLPEDFECRVSAYSLQRQARVDRFIGHVRAKYRLFLHNAISIMMSIFIAC